MPDKADEFQVLEKSKRAPRKRAAVSVSSQKEEKPKPRQTRRTTKKVSETLEPARRAPSTIAETKYDKKPHRKHTIVIGTLIAVGIISSAIVGFTDKGQIDVVTIIDERNKKAAERGEQLVSAEEELLPDGGLIPADPATTPDSNTTTPVEAVSSTASSTPQGNVPLTNEEAAALANSATST